MVATVDIKSKKIKHSMLCVTGVYLSDITNTFFTALHLNLRLEYLLTLLCKQAHC